MSVAVAVLAWLAIGGFAGWMEKRRLDKVIKLDMDGMDIIVLCVLSPIGGPFALIAILVLYVFDPIEDSE